MHAVDGHVVELASVTSRTSSLRLLQSSSLTRHGTSPSGGAWVPVGGIVGGTGVAVGACVPVGGIVGGAAVAVDGCVPVGV